MIYDHAIIGAGMAGLSTAVRALRNNQTVIVIEKTERAGGVLLSGRKNGFLLEYGPQTIQMNAALFDLLTFLKLSDEMVLADLKTPRYIFSDGRLHALPLSPPALLTSSLLSLSGRMRLMREPLIPAHAGTEDETVGDFARRRFGNEATEKLLAPFISGVWAGDMDRLSARAAFPKFVAMEKEYGSLLKSAFKKKSNGDSTATAPFPKGLVSFRDGTEALTQRMVAQVGDRLMLHAHTSRISPADGAWHVEADRGTWQAKNLIMALPAYEAAPLIHSFAPAAAAALKEIPYVPLAVVHATAKIADVGQSLEGFGFLCAPKDNRKILGCLWSSSLFPGRAPEGQALLTIYIGGARQPELAMKSDAELAAIVSDELQPILKMRAAPEILSIKRHEKAIPQYTVGHSARVETIRQAEREHSGLKFAGNYLNGISVGDVVKESA